MFFSLKDLVYRGQDGGQFFWQNIYGAPEGVTGEATTMMNENPS